MLVNEIFESVQGEGKYVGTPVLFVRLSGCTRNCSWCDTAYHKEGKEMTVTEVADRINKSKKKIVVWTGGEPMLQSREIEEVKCMVNKKAHHVETNADIVVAKHLFDYVCFSPKCIAGAENAKRYEGFTYDIKVVTDLDRVGIDLIPYATMLMPFTSGMDDYTESDKDIDKGNQYIRQKVWNYCVKHSIKYCPRLHVEVWGNKQGV